MEMDGLIRYLFFFFLYLSLCATAIGDLCDEFPDVVILINDGMRTTPYVHKLPLYIACILDGPLSLHETMLLIC